MKLRVLVLVTLLVFTAGFMVATSSSPEKTYVTGIFEDLKTTNYVNYLGPGATVWVAYVLGNMHPSLFSLSDVRFDFIPGIADVSNMAELAEQTKLNSEPTSACIKPYPYDAPKEITECWSATIKIKKGVLWSDGSELLADDVCFSYNAPMDLDPVAMGGNWPAIIDPEFFDHCQVVDKYTVKLYMKVMPGLARWQYGHLQVPILQSAYWVDKFDAAIAAKDPAIVFAPPATDEPSAGSFVFKRWEAGAFAESSKNPNFYFTGAITEEYANGAYKEYKPGVYEFVGYGDPTGDISLRFETGPFVDSVLYNIYGDQATGVLALIKGDIQYFFHPLGVAAGFRDQLKAAAGVSIVENESNGFFYLSWNMRRAPFNDLAFRQAVATLIDRAFVTDTIMKGVAFPAYSVVPRGNAYWFNPDVPVYGKEGLKADGRDLTRCERVAEAVRILKAAGYSWKTEPVCQDDKLVTKGEGLILPDGTPMAEVELMHPSAGYDPIRYTFGLWIERWLNEVGIPVKALPTGFNLIVTKVFDEQDFDMWILGWSLGLYPDHMEAFFSCRNTELGGFNPEGYCNPDFDKVAFEFLAELDIVKAKELAFRMQEFLARELPYVVLFNAPLFEAYRSDMVQYPYTQVLDGLQGANGLPSLVKVIK